MYNPDITTDPVYMEDLLVGGIYSAKIVETKMEESLEGDPVPVVFWLTPVELHVRSRGHNT